MSNDDQNSRSDHAGLSQAMSNVDDEEERQAALVGAVGEAIGAPVATEQAPPPAAKPEPQTNKMPALFAVYSHGFYARLAAEEYSLKQTIDDIDGQIAALQAKRTDAMLAYSMVASAKSAHEKGRSS